MRDVDELARTIHNLELAAANRRALGGRAGACAMSDTIHVSLTIDEREEIDTVARRIRIMAAVMTATLEGLRDTDDAVDEWADDARIGLAILLTTSARTP